MMQWQAAQQQQQQQQQQLHDSLSVVTTVWGVSQQPTQHGGGMYNQTSRMTGGYPGASLGPGGADYAQQQQAQFNGGGQAQFSGGAGGYGMPQQKMSGYGQQPQIAYNRQGVPIAGYPRRNK